MLLMPYTWSLSQRRAADLAVALDEGQQDERDPGYAGRAAHPTRRRRRGRNEQPYRDAEHSPGSREHPLRLRGVGQGEPEERD
jgi:hypothetical protein